MVGGSGGSVGGFKSDILVEGELPRWGVAGVLSRHCGGRGRMSWITSFVLEVGKQ